MVSGSRLAGLVVIAMCLAVVGGTAMGGTAAPAAATNSSSAQAVSASRVNTTWQLTLNATPTRENVSTLGLDVGESLATERTATRATLETQTLQVRLDNASTDDQRYEILSQELQAIRANVTDLNEAQQHALTDYNAGRITTHDYLYRLAEIDARANQLNDRLTVIAQVGQRIQSAAIGRQVGIAQTELADLGGALPKEAAAAYQGSVAQARIHVATSANGYVLTGIVSGDYVRQAHRYDLRTTEGPTNGIQPTVQVVYQTYPNVTAQVSSVSVDGQREAGVFYVTLESPSEQVTAFVDDRNLRIYRESYRTPISLLKSQPVADVNQAGVQLSLDQAPTTSLWRLNVTDTTNGAPVQARVALNNTVIGRTDANGKLWFIKPVRPTTIAVATGTNQSVAMTVRPNGTIVSR